MTTDTPRGPGRPPVPDHASRTRGIDVRFSRDECEWIDAHKRRRESRATFLMRCARKVAAEPST